MARVRAQGFTLIEMLVVLVVIAAMAGLLVFSMSDNPERELKREAQGLAALLNTAADEAVMQSRDLGLAINDQGYVFVVFDPKEKRWVPLLQKPLGAHQFAEGYSVEFAFDGKQIDDATRARIEKFIARGDGDTEADLQDSEKKPALLLLSSGEITAFVLTLRHEQAAFQLSSDGFNAVTVDAVALAADADATGS
jgi:general secretion pathway protein H